MANRMDIIIMGATGFTGMHCIPHIHKLSKLNGNQYSWGVAGRSKEKLKQVLEKMGNKIGTDLSSIPIITSDINDSKSLFEMAQKARLIINCVGPYLLYGERVVDACLKAGTHHVDVSGETLYMEKVQLKNEKAKEKGVYFISACGLDSIPCDLGIVYLDQNFKGVVNSVVTYLEAGSAENSSGSLVNIGTWASVVETISSEDGLNEIRSKMSSKNITSLEPKLKNRFWPHRPGIVEGWAVPFLGSDRTVVEGTQRYNYEVENKRPIQVDILVSLKSLFDVILLSLSAVMLLLFSRCRCGKNLLLKYPNFFTFGRVSKNQPSEETIENSWFQITFLGEGWSENLVDKEGINSGPCNKKIITRVKGKNPVYGATCICLVAAAVTILSERDKLAGNGNGGVFTPGAAFAKTSLIKILNDNGVTFDIIESK